MTTVKRSATAPQPQTSADLMQQAAQSTTNLGWLQDYMLDWQTVRALSSRIAQKQNQQTRKDEDAYMALLSFIALATGKCEQLEQAYANAYSKHERLMILVTEGNHHD